MVPFDSTALVAAGVCARVATTVGAGGLSIFPGVSFRIQLTLVLALSIVAIPAAIAASTTAAHPATMPLVLVLAGEALVGLAIGTAVALVVNAGAWAGGMLGSVSGLSWADDFDPDGDVQSAGMARLAWWIGLGAFLAAGGHHTIVAGLIDSVRLVPIGTVWGDGVLPGNVFPVEGSSLASLLMLIVRIPSVALSLSLSLAIPALVAVIAFHLTSAICLRTIRFAPGTGLLQALAALVLLGAVYTGADAWAGGFGALMQGPIADCFDW